MSYLLYRNLTAGLGAGAVAAIVVILISLPLKSPDDILFNTASVGFATLGIGAVNGLLWHWSAVNLPLNRRYVFTSLGLLIVALAVAAGAQTQFDSAVAFTVPLALLAVLIIVVATPFVAINRRAGLWFGKTLDQRSADSSCRRPQPGAGRAGRSGVWLVVPSATAMIESTERPKRKNR